MKKIKRFLAITMALSMVFSTNAFATPINLANSTESVATDTLDKANGTDYFDDETTNVWQDGSITEETRVTVSRASNFEITIPKEIVLNGNDGSATYKVKCEGDIAGDQVISVVPDTSFTLNEDGGKQVNITVTQPDTDFTYVELNDAKEYDGDLSAPEISAGNWSGNFYFNINFKASGCEHDYILEITKESTFTETGIKTYTCTKCNHSYTEIIPIKEKPFNDYSWVEIAAISEAGNAAFTFSVGDEKELQIGSKTYHVQILGFAHDDKSDGTGKAGITVGLKEIMTTGHVMNDTNTNVGGWKDSKMRTYVNNDVYGALPSDLQAVIKSVDKLTSEGNKSTNITTTSDKLFLLSEVEIFGSTTYSASGEGSQYQYFTDGGSKIKYKAGSSDIWWERSPFVGYTGSFCNVYGDGYANYNSANIAYGVVFGFSI